MAPVARADRSATSSTPRASTDTTSSRPSLRSHGSSRTLSAWSASSYPGISQLFVAQTQPPSLAAITPFSVIDDSYNSTLYPGGLLNTGFAVEWTQDRVDNGKPAIDPDGNIIDEGGQGWAKDRIAAGDETCAANQSLRAQNPDLVAEVFESPFYDSRQSGDLSPRLFVDKITVPTFVAGAWQDEQTGGRFPTMLDRFTGTDHLYATLVNGLHTESIGPANFPRWVEFLDLYVAKRVPTLATARFVAPVPRRPASSAPTTSYCPRIASPGSPTMRHSPPSRPSRRSACSSKRVPATTPLGPRSRASSKQFDAWPIPTVRADRVVPRPGRRTPRHPDRRQRSRRIPGAARWRARHVLRGQQQRHLAYGRACGTGRSRRRAPRRRSSRHRSTTPSRWSDPARPISGSTRISATPTSK